VRPSTQGVAETPPSVSGRPIPGDGTGIAAAPEGRLLRAQRCPDRGGGRGDVALPAGTPQEGFDARLGEPAAQVGAGCHSEHPAHPGRQGRFRTRPGRPGSTPAAVIAACSPASPATRSCSRLASLGRRRPTPAGGWGSGRQA
jgi:hypothetical protein